MIESYIIKCVDCMLPFTRFGKPVNNPLRTGICVDCKREWKQATSFTTLVKPKQIVLVKSLKVKT